MRFSAIATESHAQYAQNSLGKNNRAPCGERELSLQAFVNVSKDAPDECEQERQGPEPRSSRSACHYHCWSRP